MRRMREYAALCLVPVPKYSSGTDMLLLALFGYALALWFTFCLVRGITRSGRL